MKIADIKTHVLSTPLDEPFCFSMGWVSRRSTMIVEVVTDDGISGWGESLCHGLQPPEIAETIVQAALKPILLGQDPFDVDVLWERMYNLTRPYGQKGAVPKAIEPAKIHWFEEPISPEDIDGYRELKNLTDISLAAGENEFTKIGFRDWIACRAVDI